MQDIPPRLWYRHPCVIRNSNWRIFVGLALTVLFLNIFLPVDLQKDGFTILFTLFFCLLFLLPVVPPLVRNLYHTFRQPHEPLVRLDGDGLHLTLSRRGRTLANIPAFHGAFFGSGATNCHIAWDELRGIAVFPYSALNNEHLGLASDYYSMRKIYTSLLGDHATAEAVARCSKAVLKGKALPPDVALPPPRVRPLGWALLALNSTFAVLWFALWQLTSLGVIADPFSGFAWPYTSALAVMMVLNGIARLSPWQWQADFQEDEAMEMRQSIARL